MVDMRASLSDDERLTAGYSGRMFILLSLGWMVSTLGQSTVPPLLPTITADLAITPSQAGFALTLSAALFSVMQFFGGRLSDQLSRKTIVVTGFLVCIGGFALLSSVATYSGFLLSLSLTGIGTGLFFISSRVVLTDLFVRRRGQAFGINSAAGRVGSALSGGLAIVVLTVSTWHSSFFPVVGIFVILLVLFHRWSQERYAVSWVSFDVKGTGVRILTDVRIRWLLVAYTLQNFIVRAVSGFFPTFLQVEKGFSPTLASAGFAVLFVVGIVAMPVAGDLSDRIDPIYVATGGLLLSIFGLVAVLLSVTNVLVVVGIFVFSAGIWTFPPVIQAHLMDLISESNMGGDFGAFRTIYSGLASLGPVYVGVVAEQADYAVAFWGLTLGLLFSLGVVVHLTNVG